MTRDVMIKPRGEASQAKGNWLCGGHQRAWNVLEAEGHQSGSTEDKGRANELGDLEEKSRLYF
jgi:hypothetical protein